MKRLLIASPDGTLRQMLACLLENTGAEIDTASEEDEFEKMALERNYNIIISQFIYPFLNGFDMIGRLKDRNTRRPAVYVLSHINNEGLLMSLYESGIDQYITLPVSITRLRRKVEEELKKSLP